LARQKVFAGFRDKTMAKTTLAENQHAEFKINQILQVNIIYKVGNC